MSVKLILVGASALLSSAAIAADLTPVRKAPMIEPQPQASGYVEVYGGWATTTEDVSICGTSCFGVNADFDGWVLGGAGRGNYWISQNTSTQLDAQAEGTSYRGLGSSGSHFSNLSYLVGGHLSWRDSQRGLLGVFVGAGDAGGGFFSAIRHGVIGLEGQWYLPQLTLYLQGGYNSSIGTIGFSLDSIHAWFVRGTGRYFFTPNVMLEGTVLYANGDIDWSSGSPYGSQGFETWLWQAKLEARLGSAPFSLFAKYQGSETTYDSAAFGISSVNEKVTDHRFLVGLRLYMGESTLLSNDRKGATLDIIAPLADPSAPLNVPPSISGSNAIIIGAEPQ